MTFFDNFKKNRRQINRENQERGHAGESEVKTRYEMNGYNVSRTGKGHDYRATRHDLISGKKYTKYIEVKTGKSQLSPLQKKKKKQLGGKYVVERVNPVTFFISNNFNSFKKQHSKSKVKKDHGFSLENIFDLNQNQKKSGGRYK